MVRNTCPIDSVSQSILVAYRDWAGYQDHVRSTRNTFFDFVKLLDTSGCTKKVYKERDLIKTIIQEIDGGVLDCKMNVSNLIKNHLLTDQASYTINHKCKSCKHEDDEQSVVVDIDVKPFYTYGMKILEQVLKQRLQQKKGSVLIVDQVTSRQRLQSVAS
ncbi:kda protein in nof-fb transposable element [Lasius niger]|uniref:KDa protein in nof-fb transposable element n=1 Tax=Lasius niger TaxID=67767 RepID=A0A0J7KQN0_LASNI|nr:kda protein in nof-fb transposable element [Lasius niger]